MKTLPETMLLANQVEEISMSELRKSPGDIIMQVQMGKTFVITLRGRPVATLIKIEEAPGASKAEA